MLFSLKLRSGANQKKKEKDAGAGNKKTRTASWNLLQEILVNYISGNLYNDLFRKSRAEKCTVFQSMASPLIVYKNVIKNCSTVLQQSKHFPLVSLFVSSLLPFSKMQWYFCNSSQPSDERSLFCICFPNFLSLS